MPAASTPGRRVTIVDVARHAGVSTTAVSKVVRNAYGASPAMQTRVRAAIEQLGYRPAAAARALRGRTYTIGVLLPDRIAGRARPATQMIFPPTLVLRRTTAPPSG